MFFPHQEHYYWNEVEHLEILSRARAIENVVFVVPCGTTAAEDGPYGRTAIIDPTGRYVLQLPPREEAYGSATVDLGLIDRILIDKTDVPMRAQMSVDQAEKPLFGRRRPDAYTELTPQNPLDHRMNKNRSSH